MSQPGRRRRAGVLAGLGGLLLLGSVLAGCGEEDPFARYCEEVEQQQRPLTDALSAGAPVGLIDALPSFEALAEVAPRDLRDEWGVIVGRIRDLVEALDDAGVDAETYDRTDPPDDVTRTERRAIDAAARGLAAPETAAALEGVQQQARDVCGTQLSLASP